MKITFKGDYALKILLELSLGEKDRLFRMKDIAKQQDIPKKFLEQIVLVLKGANYVRTVRGPKGGIALARNPESVTIGEIIRLIEGTTSPIGCVSETRHEKCDFENRCAFRDLFLEVRNRTNDVVDKTTLADVARRTESIRGRRPVDYII